MKNNEMNMNNNEEMNMEATTASTEEKGSILGNNTAKEMINVVIVSTNPLDDQTSYLTRNIYNFMNDFTNGKKKLCFYHINLSKINMNLSMITYPFNISSEFELNLFKIKINDPCAKYIYIRINNDDIGQRYDCNILIDVIARFYLGNSIYHDYHSLCESDGMEISMYTNIPYISCDDFISETSLVDEDELFNYNNDKEKLYDFIMSSYTYSNKPSKYMCRFINRYAKVYYIGNAKLSRMKNTMISNKIKWYTSREFNDIFIADDIICKFDDNNIPTGYTPYIIYLILSDDETDKKKLLDIKNLIKKKISNDRFENDIINECSIEINFDIFDNDYHIACISNIEDYDSSYIRQDLFDILRNDF